MSTLLNSTPIPSSLPASAAVSKREDLSLIRLVLRLATSAVVDERLRNDVTAALRKHKLLPTTTPLFPTSRESIDDGECAARTATMSRALADKDERLAGVSSQLAAASAKLQSLVIQEAVKCADKSKALREQLEARDEQLSTVKLEFADVQHRLDVRLAAARKAADGAERRVAELEPALESCRRTLSDVTRRKDEYKLLLEQHEAKPGRALSTFRAATAEWHRVSDVLPDALELQFQRRVYELMHPPLCDAEHARFVLVRVGGVLGAEGVLEQLTLALTYAMTARRVLVVAAGSDTPLWAARDGCADASPLCFLEAPSSCRERDIADAVHSKRRPPPRSTDSGAGAAPVVVFDGGCQTEQQEACLANNEFFRAGACLTCPGGRLWLEGQLTRYIFQPRDFVRARIKAARAALERDWPLGAPIVGVDVARAFDCYTAAGQRSMACPEAPLLSKALRTLAERVPIRGALAVSESQFAIDSLRQHELAAQGVRVFAAANLTRLCERPQAPVREQPDFPLRAGCAVRYFFGPGGRAKPSLRQQFLDAPAFNATAEIVDRFVELGLVLQAEHFVGVSTSPFSRVAIRLMYAFDQLHGDFGSLDWLLVDDSGNNWPFGNAAMYLQSLTQSAVASNRILQHVVKAQADAPLFAGSLRVAQPSEETSTSDTPSTTGDEAGDGVGVFVQRQQQAAAALAMQNRRIPSLAAKSKGEQ